MDQPQDYYEQQQLTPNNPPHPFPVLFQPQPLPLSLSTDYYNSSASTTSYADQGLCISPSALGNIALPPVDYPTSSSSSSNNPSGFATTVARQRSESFTRYDGESLPTQQASLSSAVDSARWSGDLEVLPSFPSHFPALASTSYAPPPVPVPYAFPGPAYEPSSSYTVGQALSSFPSTLPPIDFPPLPAVSSDYLLDGIIDGPTGVQSRVKPFIAKLSHLLEKPEQYADVIVWDASGETFIVHHSDRFHKEVLPKLFGHGQSASFTRQLNVYGFRRLSNTDLAARIDVPSTTNYSAWRHEQFKKGGKADLHLFNPRPSRARATKKEEQARRASECSGGADGGGARAGGSRGAGGSSRSSSGSQTDSPDSLLIDQAGEAYVPEQSGLVKRPRRAQ